MFRGIKEACEYLITQSFQEMFLFITALIKKIYPTPVIGGWVNKQTIKPNKSYFKMKIISFY